MDVSFAWILDTVKYLTLFQHFQLVGPGAIYEWDLPHSCIDENKLYLHA